MRMRLAIGLALLLIPSLSPAATYYVANGGGGSTCSIGSPCGTIAAGLAKLAAGDTLYLRGGTYTEQINSQNQVIRSGTSWANPTTIGAYPGEIVVLNHSQGSLLLNSYNTTFNPGDLQYLIFANLIFDPQNSGASALGFLSPYLGDSGPHVHHVRLLNCEIRNAGQPAAPPLGNNGASAFGGYNYEFVGGSCHDGPGYCFYINGANHLFDGMEFYNLGAYAVHANESDGSKTIDNMTIRNTRMHNVGGAFSAGITLVAANAVNNAQVYNNLLYNNPNEGIQISSNNRNALVANNTVYANTGVGIHIFDNGGGVPTGTIIRNNIVYANGSSITVGGGISVTQDHNLTTDPAVVNAGGGDYHLQSGSAARDAGTTVPAVATDKDGLTRPQGFAYAIGAYEFPGGSAPPVPTAFRVGSMN